MKKRNLTAAILIVAVVTAAAVTGCGGSAQKTETVVQPVYALESAQDALADGSYPVSFTADDLAKTENGYELTVEVYEYDRYEKDAIDHLTAGSKMQYCGKEVTVDKVEKDSETGFVQINGGIENDGIELTEEDGLYRTITVDDYPIYYSVGKVTIPMSDEVTFEDQANAQQDSDVPVVELKDLPDALANSELSFNCNSTVITVRGEQIVQIIRYWVP